MKLENKIVVIAGGTGAVGEGIVKSLLHEGAITIVPVRTKAKGEVLKSYVQDHQNLYLWENEESEDDNAANLKKWVVEKFGRIDLAIASLGGWYQGGRLDQMPTEDWHMVMNNNLNSHFYFAKAMMSYFHEVDAGMFVMINGGAAEMVVPGAASMSIIAMAQLTMTQALAAEAKGTNIKVHSVIAITPVKTRARPVTPPSWISAEEIGDYILGLFVKRDGAQVVHKIPL